MQKHSVKLLLRNSKKNHYGHIAIYLRIIIDRVPAFKSMGYYIPENFWDEKNERVKPGYELAEIINTYILNHKKEALNNIVHASVEKRIISARGIKAKTAAPDNLFTFAEKHIRVMKSKREDSTLKIWRKHLQKIEDYAGRNITFYDITTDWLNEFEYHLRNGGIKIDESKGDGSNYIGAIMKSLRTFFNAADMKTKGHYPFTKYEMPEYTPGDKEYLSLPQIYKWEEYLSKERRKEPRQVGIYFLFGCYTGLRISDWYLFDVGERVKKDYIQLRAKKNGEWITTPIHAGLKRVLKLVEETPITIEANKFYEWLDRIATECAIKKHLSPHSSRRTFAVTLCLERGMTSETAATLMGITLETFVKNYAAITPHKIKKEVDLAWKDLK